MQYMGGKDRIGGDIAKAIMGATPLRKTYVEPFLGGANMIKHIKPHFNRLVLSDAHEDLILMWKAVRNGWEPPSVISEADYLVERSASPSPRRGFVGFGCSFGGKWFGGYARESKSGKSVRDYTAGSMRSVLATRPHLEGCEIHCRSFADIKIEHGDVVYCDPPYRGKTGYKGGFDHDLFWEKANAWAAAGACVFVSEYSAPSEWEEIWWRAVSVGVNGAQKPHATERLFTRSLS